MKIPHVSASQVDSFRNCKRLWYLQKVKKHFVEASPSQELGTEVHADLENYLGNQGYQYKHPALIRPVLEHLPRPSENLLLEHEFWLPTLPGCPPMMGYMDVIDPEEIAEGWLLIGDHKTTKNFKYVKTKKDLKTNTQALVYARWGYQIPYLPWFPVPPTNAWKGVDKANIRFKHFYIRTTEDEPAARVTSVDLTESSVNEGWDGFLGDIEQMVVLAENDGKHHLKIEPNAKACYLYGGCPFKKDGTCSDLWPGKKTSGGELNMSALMDKIKARKAASEMPEESISMPQEAVTETTIPSEQKSLTLVPETPAIGIIPPDAPSREISPGESAEEKGKKKKPKKEEVEARNGGYKWLFVGALSSTIGPLAEELGMIPVPLERWIRPYEQAICEEMGVADVGLVDFGKGKGALAALVSRMVAEAPKALWTGDAMGRFVDIVASAYIAEGHIVIKKT